MYKDRFYQLAGSYVDFAENTKDFEGMLKRVFDGSINNNEIKTTVSKIDSPLMRKVKRF